MYVVEKGDSLTITELGRILNKFKTNELPKLIQYENYYNGKQHILTKIATDDGKPCNKVITNYCRNIVNSYEGYLSGVAINYSGENFDTIRDILNYNDVKAEDSEFLRQALIYGRAFEICYLDSEAKQRFKVFNSTECIPIYDNTIENNLLYVIRFWKVDRADINQKEYKVEVYSSTDIKTYRSAEGFSSFQLINSQPHYYGQCPISVFQLNKQEESIFSQVMTLQDAYNTLLSGEIDDWESFCDAYLVIKGMIADNEDLADMKKHRALMVESDASVEYLTKNVSDTQISNMLKLVNDNIHKIAACPDFSQESFGTSSGIALRFRLLGFENAASAIESNFKLALQKRIELLSAIVNLTDESLWRDVTIVFTRNLPNNVLETAQIINQLRGIVSTNTLLTQLPFVTDVAEELEKIKAEQSDALAMYMADNE